MQFDRDETGTLRAVAEAHDRHRMGLERIASVLQGMASNYDTDLFRPMLEAIADLSGVAYGRSPDGDVGFPGHRGPLRARPSSSPTG